MMGSSIARTFRNAVVEGRGRRVGFTLVELLVVMGIIGVLVSMMFPMLRLVKAQGYVPLITADGKRLTLVQNVRSFRGGFSFTF